MKTSTPFFKRLTQALWVGAFALCPMVTKAQYWADANNDGILDYCITITPDSRVQVGFDPECCGKEYSVTYQFWGSANTHYYIQGYAGGQWHILNYLCLTNADLVTANWPEGQTCDTYGSYRCVAITLPPIHTITINTFIPHNNVDDPENANPFATNHVYEGDNRMSGAPPRAAWDKNGAYRTRQRFNVIAAQSSGDVDGLQDNAYANDADGIPNDAWLHRVGITRKYHKASSLDTAGNLTAAALADTTLGDAHMKVAQGTASSSGITISPTWISGRKIKIRCVVSIGNPLAPSTLWSEIDYDFELTIDYTNMADPRYSLTGAHDGFPAYEFYIDSMRIHEHDPLATGEDLTSLLFNMEHSVNQINNPL